MADDKTMTVDLLLWGNRVNNDYFINFEANTYKSESLDLKNTYYTYHLILNRRKGHIYAAYADNCFLPFALLAARTFLPPGVLILALNP